MIQAKSIPNTECRFLRWTGDISATDIFKIEPTIAIDTNKAVSATFCTKCGDVNGDLKITPSGAQKAFEIYLGRIANPTDCEKENADVNCSGIKSEPKITPADAPAIFNKYLRKGELPSDCSGNSRAAALTLEKVSLPNLRLIINDMTIAPGEEVIVPVIVESPNDINAFGFDLIFPSDTLKFITLERTALTKDFEQLAANMISYNSLCVGGFKPQLTQNSSHGVLVTLVLKAVEEVKEGSSISIISTHDDIENASIKNRTIYPKTKENERTGREIEGKRFDY